MLVHLTEPGYPSSQVPPHKVDICNHECLYSCLVVSQGHELKEYKVKNKFKALDEKQLDLKEGDTVVMLQEDPSGESTMDTYKMTLLCVSVTTIPHKILTYSGASLLRRLETLVLCPNAYC